jgi:hypothetical protein
MSLLALQRDFRSWLTQECAAAADRLGSGAGPGLGVYLNNYRGQLIAALSTSFEGVRAWLGDRAFETAAAVHIDERPPSGWTLDAYAVDFPDTLERLYPADPEVGELARFERELERAFVAADAPPLDLAALGDLDWEAAVLRTAPSVALLPATTNAAAIWSAIMLGLQPPAAARLAESCGLLVWRSGFTPRFRTLEAPGAGALGLVIAGATFGEVCALLVEQMGPERGPLVAGEHLGRWLADGLIVEASTAQ